MDFYEFGKIKNVSELGPDHAKRCSSIEDLGKLVFGPTFAILKGHINLDFRFLSPNRGLHSMGFWRFQGLVKVCRPHPVSRTRKTIEKSSAFKLFQKLSQQNPN